MKIIILIFASIIIQNTLCIDASFPSNFIWGSATAAYQVEGAYNVDGRQLSIWDVFSHTPNKTYDNQTGDVADDEYYKFKDDLAILKSMNVTYYRFSISWSRIMNYNQQNGTQVNQKGIDHYNKLIDTMQEMGIIGVATIYHWDLPQYLNENIAGWLDEDIVQYYQQYADVCFSSFGDRIKIWITMNEPLTFCLVGYGAGIHAPGRCSDRQICNNGNSSTEPYIASHNVLRSHAFAVDLYRKYYQQQQQGKIGITLNSDWAEPLTNSTEDQEAAERNMLFTLGWYADPVVFGDYPEVMKQSLGDRLPVFNQKEKNLLKGSYDFIGINHYSSHYSSNKIKPNVSQNHDDDQNVKNSFYDAEGNLMGLMAASPWLCVVPYGIRNLLNWISIRYNNPILIITENGVDVPNEVNLPLDQIVNDQFRIDYLMGYLENVRKAIVVDNVNVIGYFVWSLLDNFEWADGYSKKFGLYHIDMETQTRTAKQSSLYYSQYIKNNTRQD